jgi:hypothetical protein
MIDRHYFVGVLSRDLPAALATGLVEHWMQVRSDVSTRTLGNAAPGKFVEVLVQTLQFLDSGNYEAKPEVDAFLKSLDNTKANLPEDLRLCAARIARGVYTLRNKRNIAHIGSVDPNVYDLKLLLSGIEWILSELVRTSAGVTASEAGRVIEQVQAPVSVLVEDIGSRRIVLGDVSARSELLILLHSFYPEWTSTTSMRDSLHRRESSGVSKALVALWKAKLVEKDQKAFKLTLRGFAEAERVIIENAM